MQCFLPIAEIPRKFKQMQQQNTKGLTLLQGEKQNTHKEWSQTINYQQWWGLWHCTLSTAVWSSGPILIRRGQEKILPHKWWLKSRAQIVSRLDNNHFFWDRKVHDLERLTFFMQDKTYQMKPKTFIIHIAGPSFQSHLASIIISGHCWIVDSLRSLCMEIWTLGVAAWPKSFLWSHSSHNTWVHVSYVTPT